MEGKTHAIFARRQLEHGDNLSQRTFRERHTTQLRGFGADEFDLELELELLILVADMGELAFFSEGEAKAPALTGGVGAENVTGGTCHCDMVEWRRITGSGSGSVLQVLPD
jgi:hypothetical protein